MQHIQDRYGTIAQENGLQQCGMPHANKLPPALILEVWDYCGMTA